MSTTQDEPVAIGFYRWYAANPQADRQEKRKRAALYIRRVLVPLWLECHPKQENTPQCRRYHRQLLQCYYQCIDQDSELPPEPRYPLRRVAEPQLNCSLEGL